MVVDGHASSNAAAPISTPEDARRCEGSVRVENGEGGADGVLLALLVQLSCQDLVKRPFAHLAIMLLQERASLRAVCSRGGRRPPQLRPAPLQGSKACLQPRDARQHCALDF